MVVVQLASHLGLQFRGWVKNDNSHGFFLALFLCTLALSTKSKHAVLSGFDKAKYELYKYHAERYLEYLLLG